MAATWPRDHSGKVISGDSCAFETQRARLDGRIVSELAHLQHMQQRRLAGIVEAEEQQLGVLVEQAERREDVVDCRGGRRTFMSASCPRGWVEGRRKATQHTPVDNPHLGRRCEAASFLLSMFLVVGLVQEATAAWSDLGGIRGCVGWWRGRRRKVLDKGTRLDCKCNPCSFGRFRA